MQNGPAERRDADIARDGRLAALRGALSWTVVKRSLVVMLVVGSILNVINQGDALWSAVPINWWKLALTYCVPFCVATYGAYCALCAIGMKR